MSEIPCELFSEARAFRKSRAHGDERARSALTMVRDLEASLHASRNALLARDLAGIEQETREQVRSIRKLEDFLARSMAPRARGLKKNGRSSAPETRRNRSRNRSPNRRKN